eukprot:TRINITY_DN15020_c0_g1_i3.p1 TRINITY_DN15020_c0_g1~~TRINITY_DN15020_c0_g1_i3.p1  ORF type:complete len:480 (+),score=103.64 TRINITY_DN15020_c0_g1_i3:92-1531(+)
MAGQASGGQDIAVKKALEAFRKDLMPVLQLDMKTYFVAQVKQELGTQLRDELRKEMKQLSTKVAKDMSTNSEGMKKILAEQVTKIENTSAALQSTSMKAMKVPLKAKLGGKGSQQASISSAAPDPTKRRHSMRKAVAVRNALENPLFTSDDEMGPRNSLLPGDPREFEIAGGEPELDKSTLPVLETQLQITVDAVLNHSAFDICMAIIILLGCILMGVSLQYGVHDHLGLYDVVTACIFVTELMARFYCYRCKFFTMPGFEWNIFDLCIVGCNVLSIMGQTTSTISGLKSLRGLRGLRALRSLRVLRSLRLLRFVEEFRGVITSMLASLKSMLGVLFVFSFAMYLFGACIASEVLEMKRSMGEENVSPDLLQYFGTLTTSMLTLCESVTGGLSWSVVMDVFMMEGYYTMAIAYVLFIALCVFVLLNVLLDSSFFRSLVSDPYNNVPIYSTENITEHVARTANARSERREAPPCMGCCSR